MASNGEVKMPSDVIVKHSDLISAQFNVWRQTMPYQLKFKEDTGDHCITTVEWMSDLFDAALLTENMPLDQLRNCHLTSKQTHILATLVPDEIINLKHLEKKETITFVGVLLFADVSGFTALCEKYNNTGKGGTYRLTATLNGYIGAMVEVIYSHGGDVLKFSGDAFLAIWKVKRDEFMFLVIHNALSCALYIQQTMGSFETDVKVLLKVKLAISAGNLSFAVIGDDKSRHYIVCGTPINDVKMAEHTCASGDVVLAPSAWGHCSPSNYEYTYKDLQNVKVTRIIYNPGMNERQVVYQFREKVNVLLDSKKKVPLNKQAIHEKNEIEPEDKADHSPVSVRPIVIESSKRKLGTMLRPFLIPPVVQQVDADQPLEFLTELRQVTTMFVNLIPSQVPTKALILMVDEAYTTICRLVRSAMGCVNKVCMFDKDVMFLVIFGLRGYKHGSESRNGLKCAFSVLKAVYELQGVSCVSIGVTTGMVYCGVVGHPLRREYTVIGGPVNKAARIMCAYPGKVTCEQNTFLHSKLPANLFILQEAKELKGIGTVGPIYEYTEEKKSNSVQGLNCGLFPILGREDTLQMFQSLLQPNRVYSGMLIEGEARMGKSRLLDELINEAKLYDLMPILISLNPMHFTVPYAVTNQLFKQVLGLKESATARDKEELLIKTLGGEVAQDDLCYLNDIMQVKFPHSACYLVQSPEERNEVIQHIFQSLLCLSNKKLIIAVDDAQYIDQDSWKLLLNTLNDRSTLLVMTMYCGHQRKQMPGMQELLSNKNMFKVYLSGLKDQHLAPLACQILNVQAISPEVEFLLQCRSGGNPGWCESFLVTLIQSGGLKVEEIPEKEIHTKSLIVPDINLVMKKPFHLTKSETMLFEVNKAMSVDKNEDDDRDDPKSQRIVSACVVTSNFKINEIVVPQNIEGLIMTAFDSLIPYEQLLLKCASVLGDTFTRSMLVAVMHNPTPQQTAQAIKHLFEMRVLNCGTDEADNISMQNTNFVVPREHRSIMEQDRIIYCNCHYKPDAEFEESSTLPSYAFCRLLHFRIPQFRETTYELLPGNQKKEFHARAVGFLENEAHKCKACGGGNFIYISPEEFQVKKNPSENDKCVSMISRSVIAPRTNVLLPSCSSKISPQSNEDITTSHVDPSTIQDQIARSRVKMKPKLLHAKRLHAIKSGSYDIIHHTNGEVDFRNCECPFILSGVYQQLIKHCAAAGLKDKQIRFLIEFGAAAITIGNNTQAINVLKDAEELSKAGSEDDDHPLSHSARQQILGRIHALIGQANLDLGQLNTARKHLGLAMSYFGKPIPTWHITAVLKLQWQMYKQYFHQQFPRAFLGKTCGKKAIIYNEIAACLSHLSNLYMVEHKWLLAKLAAVQSLNLVQCPNTNLYELCAAYSNMMDVLHHYGKLNYCLRLEGMALHTAKDKYVGEEAKELLALGRLYCATFSSRLLRGELVSAIKTGFRTLQISNRVYANNVKLFVLPMLIQALLMSNRMAEAVDLLQELAFTAEEDLDQSSATWYHALCLDMILDTCFAVEKPSTCCAFGEWVASGIIVRDPDSVRRLAISMWVWYTRKQEWVEAKKWEDRVSQYRTIRSDDSFSNLISSLKYFECMLVSITACLDSSRPTNITDLHSDINTFIRQFEEVAKVVKIILPRFLHLKAYFYCLKNHKAKAVQLLSEAAQVSKQQQNMLQLDWIKHSNMNWSGSENKIDEIFWQEHSSDDTCIDWHEFNMHNLKKILYTLPIPRNPLL